MCPVEAPLREEMQALARPSRFSPEAHAREASGGRGHRRRRVSKAWVYQLLARYDAEERLTVASWVLQALPGFSRPSLSPASPAPSERPEPNGPFRTRCRSTESLRTPSYPLRIVRDSCPVL